MWTIVLAVAAGAVVVLQAWGAIDAVGWDDLEDRVGPIRAIVSVAAVGPIAVLERG